MTKKMLTYLVVLAFACSSMLILASCASRQVTAVSEAQKPAEEKPPEVKEVKPAEPTVTEEERQREAERLAALRELEEKQKVADQLRMFESEKIYFDFDKADLRQEAKEVLKTKADWLRAHPSYSLIIEGHCDDRGTNEYNLALGDRRANAAKKFLVALGISAERLTTISYGEERPADPRHNEDAWSKNRRDEFKLIR